MVRHPPGVKVLYKKESKKETNKQTKVKTRELGCLFRGPEFNPKLPNGVSQPSMTPVPEDPMPSSDVLRHQPHRWYTVIYAGQAFIHTLTHTSIHTHTHTDTQTHTHTKSFFKNRN